MVTIRIYRWLASLFVVAGIFFISACGKESPPVNPNDTINGSQLIPDAYSVSPRKQVYFSQGNLQKWDLPLCLTSGIKEAISVGVRETDPLIGRWMMQTSLLSTIGVTMCLIQRVDGGRCMQPIGFIC